MRLRLIAIVAAMLPLCAAASDRAALFDRAWSLVDRHYWDRSFGGQDWAAARDHYRGRAIAAADQASFYAALNAMLASIGDSHVYARSPADLAVERAPDRTKREAREVALDVWLVRFDAFMPPDERWLRATMRAVRPEALILDLRDNGGGRDDVLDRIAGIFLPSGTPLLLREDAIEKTVGKRLYNRRIYVLIGPRTASAAELLAAALDRAGADVIGQRSKGAVTGGADYRLPDGGRLTVADYDVRLPDGTRIEKVGVRPRHVVADRPGEDAPLACALHLAKGGAAC
ncbi:S41 family peptidase [Sphingomonas crocodyli]|nr:S41 family peptidase [Sphingomonas crocodyli]